MYICQSQPPNSSHLPSLRSFSKGGNENTQLNQFLLNHLCRVAKGRQEWQRISPAQARFFQSHLLLSAGIHPPQTQEPSFPTSRTQMCPEVTGPLRNLCVWHTRLPPLDKKNFLRIQTPFGGERLEGLPYESLALPTELSLLNQEKQSLTY